MSILTKETIFQMLDEAHVLLNQPDLQNQDLKINIDIVPQKDGTCILKTLQGYAFILTSQSETNHLSKWLKFVYELATELS
jgi:hypothetical protein